MSTTIESSESDDTGNVATNSTSEGAQIASVVDTDSPAVRETELKGADAAMVRAKDRIEKNKNSSSDKTEQAAGDDKSASVSTQNASEEDKKANDGNDAISDESSVDNNNNASDASTVTAPDNWPATMVAQFDALPDDSARSMILDMNKDMQSGMTKGMQQLRTQIDENSQLFGLMDQHSLDASGMGDLVNKSFMFNADPRGLITQLAKEKGIEVFFDQASAKGEVPEFDSPADMATWAMQQAKRELTTEMDQREASKTETSNRKSLEDKITQQFAQATKDHTDFSYYREPVIEKMADAGENGISVNDAYRLSTYDGLRKLADEGQAAKNELAELKTKVERAKKKDAAAPGGGAGDAENAAFKNFSPAQRAAAKAKERIAKAAH